jgi:hypothetical protein
VKNVRRVFGARSETIAIVAASGSLGMYSRRSNTTVRSASIPASAENRLSAPASSRTVSMNPSRHSNCFAA